MSELNCSIVRDLMPSYADGLLSDETKAAVEAHIASCESCREELALMCADDGPEAASVDASTPVPEIDYLRKNRRRNLGIALISIASALLLAAGVLFAKLFIIGSEQSPGRVACSVDVDGNKLDISGSTVEGSSVSKLVFRENDGVVTVKTRSVLYDLFFGKSFKGEYTAKTEIEKVIFNDDTLWASSDRDGFISPAVRAAIAEDWALYNARDDMSKWCYNGIPGFCYRYFPSWDDALSFISGNPWNPFEQDSRFKVMNSTGTEITEPDGSLAHTLVSMQGQPNGDVDGISICSGYRLNDARVIYTIQPVVSSDSSLTVVPFTVEEIVEMSPDLNLKPSDIEECELAPGVICRMMQAMNFKDLNYCVDGVRYNVHIVSTKGDAALDRAVDTVLELLRSELAGKN